MRTVDSEHVARIIRRPPPPHLSRAQHGLETATTIQRIIADHVGQHPHQEYLNYMALRYRTTAQELLKAGGYGLLQAFNLYQDAIDVIATLRHLPVPPAHCGPRLCDWRKSNQAAQRELQDTSRNRVMEYLQRVAQQPADESSILVETSRQLAHAARILYDDFMPATAQRVQYIEFAIDAKAAIG